MKNWEPRPKGGWYKGVANAGEKTHFWQGTVTLCGKTWHGWKWRMPTHRKCQKCIKAFVEHGGVLGR